MSLAEHGIRKRRFESWDMAFTDAETASFRAYQLIHERDPGIEAATPDEILRFMDHLAASGRAGATDAA